MFIRSDNSIANRMTASVLIFSLLLTLVSFAGLYVINYREATDRVEMNLRQLAKANIPGINESLWVMDMQQLQLQLNSLLNIPHLCEVKIEANGRILASAGTARLHRTTRRTFPLSYTFDGRTMPLGTLHVQVCYEDIYQELIAGTYIRLLLQTVQIALVAIFMLYIFRCIVSRRLSIIKDHMTGIDTGRLDAPLELPKSSIFKGNDELDMLVESFNVMLARIEEGVSERKRTEEVIKSLNNQLEERIRERTAELEASNTSLLMKNNEVLKIAEDIKESRQQFLDIIEFIPDATYVVDNDMKVIVWNRAMEKMSGVSKAEMVGQGDYAYTIPFYGDRRPNLIDLLDASDEDIKANYNDVMRENITLYAEIFCPALNGGKGAFVWAVAAPLYNIKGVRVGAIESIRNVTDRHQAKEALKQAYTEVENIVRVRTAELDATNTALTNEINERKQAEEQIRRSLQEKEVLLKEIHHRVKNNMQVIYSLLNLQAKQIADSQVRAMFEESRDRINSMSLIHESLYQSANLAHIDFKKYLETLVQGIAGTYRSNEVNISVEMEPIALDVNVGIPCGLIVNELVSNSLKYAFPEGQKGTIRVGINRNSEGDYLMTVEDDGIGFPEDLDFRKTKSLGMQLVTILSGQIKGTIELSTTVGTKFSITFPVRMENNG